MNETKILVCSPSGELQWVNINSEDVTIKDGVILVKGDNTLITDATIVPDEKNTIGQKAQIEVTPVAYLDGNTLYVAGRYIDLALPQIKETNATIIEIFCDNIQEVEKFFENDGIKAILDKCANILLEPFIYFFNREDCNGKGVLVGNKDGAIILNEYLNKIPDKSILVHYPEYYTPLYSNSLFSKKIFADIFNEDVTLTNLLKREAVYSYSRNNVLVDRENKLFMVIDTGNEDKEYIAKMMNTKYKDWTLYIFSNDGLYVLPSDRDFSKINEDWLIEHTFVANYLDTTLCNKKLNSKITVKESKFDILKMPLNILKDILNQIKDSADEYKLSNSVRFKNNTLYVTNFNVYEILSGLDIEWLNIAFCFVGETTNFTSSEKELSGFEVEKDTDKNSEMSSKEALLASIDFEDYKDYEAFLNFFENDEYNLIHLKYHWYNAGDWYTVIVTLDKTAKTVSIDNDKQYTSYTYIGNGSGVFTYKEIKNIMQFTSDYSYVCNIRITQPVYGRPISLTPTNLELFDVLYFAYTKGFLNKFYLQPPIKYGNMGQFLNNPYVFDWNKIEKKYSRDFVYAVLDTFFKFNDTSMYRYIVEYNCFEYEVPNKYYPYIVEKYSKNKDRYLTYLQKAKNIANIVKENLLFPVVENFEFYVYNRLYQIPTLSEGINWFEYILTDCLGDREGRSIVPIADISAVLETEEVYFKNLSYCFTTKKNGDNTFEVYPEDYWEFKFDFKIAPDKEPIVFVVCEYDKQGKKVGCNTYSISDYKLGGTIKVTDYVTLNVGTTECIGSIYALIDCNDNWEKTNNISYVINSAGMGAEKEYCCDERYEVGYNPIKSVTFNGGVYKSTSDKNVNYTQFDNDVAIFDIHSIKETADGWIEVRITPKVKLKSEEQERFANSIIIDDGIIPKGEV